MNVKCIRNDRSQAAWLKRNSKRKMESVQDLFRLSPIRYLSLKCAIVAGGDGVFKHKFYDCHMRMK